MDKIEIIFNLYKDEIIIPKKFRQEMYDKYNMDERKSGDLWIRINNYQVNKYGSHLTTESNILSAEECNQRRVNANQRIYKRIHG